MAQLVEVGGAPINPTEQWIVQRLLQSLPSHYCVLPNLSLAEERGGHVYEYDVVVLTPFAVHVLEIKAWSGTLTALSRQDWQLESGLIRRNPLQLTDLKARILGGLLKSLPPFREGNRTLPTPYVQAALVVGSDETTFQVLPDDLPRCLRPGELLSYLTDPQRLARRPDGPLYARFIPSLAQFLAGQLKGRTAAPRRFGSYLQLETLSQEEDCAVYLARHALLTDGRLYRVRTWRLSPYKLSPEARAEKLHRLRRSAEALSLIGDHPNILPLREFGEQDDLFYEITDWSERGTLANALAKGQAQRWSLPKKLHFLGGVARGLAAAAAHDVFHRNLSPQAILLGDKDVPRLTGFDRAFILSAQQTIFGSTTDLEQLAYLPPELHSLEHYDVFENTDLYSLGILALELFTGKPDLPPLSWREASGDSEVMDPPALHQALSALPPAQQSALRSLLRGLLQPSPAQRIGTAQAVIEALKQLLSPEPTPDLRHAQALFDPGECIDGRYTVERLVGEGAQGKVYAVQYAASTKPLALKISPPRDGLAAPDPMLPLLLLNGRTTSQPIPRLVQYISAGIHRVSPSGPLLPYAVMPLLTGEPLMQRLQQTPCTRREALHWAWQLLTTLKRLHTPGSEGEILVHRDLRPANLMVVPTSDTAGNDQNPDSELWVIDLDCLAPVSSAGTTVPGALRYAPPDIDRCGWSPDADRFSVGVMLYEWLSGQHPWPGTLPLPDQNPQPLPQPSRDASQDASHGPSPALPGGLLEALVETLAPQQSRRLAVGDRLALELQALLFPTPTPEPEPTPAPARLHEPLRLHEPEPEPDVGPLWTEELVEALISASHPAGPLYQRLRDRIYLSPLPDAPAEAEQRFLHRESLAAQLERPLPLSLSCLYDALLSPLFPAGRTVSDLASPSEPTLLLDHLHLAELPALLTLLSAAGWEVEEQSWIPGVTPLPTTPETPRCSLPPGRLDQGSLAELLNMRRQQLTEAVRAFLARLEQDRHPGPAQLIALSGVVYLHQGRGWQLPDALPSYFRTPPTPAQAGGEPRTAQSLRRVPGPTLPGPPDLPVSPLVRFHGTEALAVGRLFWPRKADAPRLDFGGLSLLENVLPWLTLRRAPAVNTSPLNFSPDGPDAHE